ncbi:ThiF family adenylyltransferase [Curtobacterium sp. RRHDQ10]|uniref:ThiF family adenylyltransferase n=1 Tax=Curtobacterium phyllosphaerae TaxID=3413379 RepID=UPI003BF2A736
MHPLVEPVGTLSAARRRLGSRTAALHGVEDVGLRRLAALRVLVVGAGGLGSPVVALLAGSGLGRLTVVDPDVVDVSNLARQTLFTTEDVGAPKAEAAAARARLVDPELDVRAVVGRFDVETGPALVAGHDVVVDAADGVDVTRAVSDACADAGVPFVWASALGTDGQVAVFWDGAPSGAVDFHDLHPDPFVDEGSCAVDGVLAGLCTMLGGIVAGQVVALATGVGEPLLGRVLTVDAATWTVVASPLRRGPTSRRPPRLPSERPVTLVSPAGLEARLASGAPLAVLDVRTPAERAGGVITGSVVPADLPDGVPVVVYCARGPRADAWARGPGLGRDVVVLDGGVEAWLREDRPLVPVTQP